MTVRFVVSDGFRLTASPPAASVTSNVRSVSWVLLDWAMTPPVSSIEPRVFARPAYTVSLPRSELKSPVLSTTNANTAATTTKAIRTIAVSRPVMPRSSRTLRMNSAIRFTGLLRCDACRCHAPALPASQKTRRLAAARGRCTSLNRAGVRTRANPRSPVLRLAPGRDDEVTGVRDSPGDAVQAMQQPIADTARHQAQQAGPARHRPEERRAVGALEFERARGKPPQRLRLAFEGMLALGRVIPEQPLAARDEARRPLRAVDRPA